MDFHPAQLAALVAIIDHGSFDAAARHLSVTPSAISQRIRALERNAGSVLVTRATPCRPTPAGGPVLRLGRQLQLLVAEAGLAGDLTPTPILSVAVNADSLSGWFRDVVAEVATWSEVALRLSVEDQAHTHELLRSGEVMGAVTSEPEVVQGCRTVPLGHLRYRPVAATSLLERYGGRADWARMPVVRFNAKDTLQDEELARRGVGAPAVIHRVPSSDDFAAAVRAGLGWGMLPDHQWRQADAAGGVVALGRRVARVPLHWQRWKLDSPHLDRLTEAVLQHAPR